MALKFFDFLRPKSGTGQTQMVEVSCKELFEAAQEFQIRQLCFWTCVDMIANAVGRCEFRTFRAGAPVREREYYLWNFEPNVNQNSTAFLHKLIAKLYTENEALIVSTRRRDGMEAIVVADEWARPAEEWPSRQNEYTGVVVGAMSYDKTFRESDVIHLKLNHANIKPVLDGVYQSYYKLIAAAMKNYAWDKGQHWKVHVSQIAQGGDQWAENFTKMIEAQIKPFLNSETGAILPEFDGYEYTNMATQKASQTTGTTRDIKDLVEDIFDFTARALLVPAVLVNGKIEGTNDANSRFLTYCIDPLCDQLGEEIVRKRYGYDKWAAGDYLQVDSSTIVHYDLFGQAANVEKLVGSGVYTINDIRRAAGQAPIAEDWANTAFLTKNIATLTDSVAAQ